MPCHSPPSPCTQQFPLHSGGRGNKGGECQATKSKVFRFNLGLRGPQPDQASLPLRRQQNKHCPEAHDALNGYPKNVPDPLCWTGQGRWLHKGCRIVLSCGSRVEGRPHGSARQQVGGVGAADKLGAEPLCMADGRGKSGCGCLSVTGQLVEHRRPEGH